MEASANPAYWMYEPPLIFGVDGGVSIYDNLNDQNGILPMRGVLKL